MHTVDCTLYSLPGIFLEKLHTIENVNASLI